MPDSKPCTKCGKDKPLDDYSPGSGKFGRKSRCRECSNEDHGLRYQTRSDTARDAAYERTRNWRADNPDTARDGTYAYRERHPGKAAEWQAAYAQRLRQRVLEHYGTECACCGSAEDLCVDHIIGNGKQHREELFGHSPGAAGEQFWRWLVQQGFPAGYQILCRPCSSSKSNREACRLAH